MHVAVRELKSGLSRFLSLAQSGELIEVTSHNKPIARILGIPPQANEGLRRLMASGTLSWHGDKPKLSPSVELARGGKPVSQMLLEDRG
ncbi:type II toxin-antitoxin system Phd/YefM family antitoxin [Candidatus Symbiobacter mobilis]|uniref:Prevent-host-death family protein n=1 Tax=Candidatus Symbiobacter mobilis CR TaxID=946483 RepID=U5NEA6_9BURK|nr:type II toxin-antitoxin system prevent-host-death family antitoxin [Candidatus Symbiobacter mobilis]AGX88474.1 prevent-host-death family protein [Candidatus Symbiobacter mobilis CR]